MPSIIDGLFAGRAGIQSHGAAIGVLGDNIANANTVGFKSARPDFTDLLAGSLGGSGAITVGSGSQLNSVTQVFNQGTFEFTGRGLDLAVDGNGFFVVEDQGGTGARYYTRAGNMSVDADGNLLNQNGYNVMGFVTGGGGGLQALNVNQRAQATIDTNTVTISGNLDASTTQPNAVPPGPAYTYNQLAAADFSTFVDVFDSLGGSHTLTTYFFHTGSNQWQAMTFTDSADITGTGGTPMLLGQQTFTFLSNGLKNTPAVTPDYQVNATWNNGSFAQTIDMILDPFSQFSSSSAINSISQDGTGGGSVVSFSVQADGSLVAQLDNGQTANIGTVALATFANVEGMSRSGDSLYKESVTSGEPVVGTPGTGTFGGIAAGSLELSTSDIAADFIKLISYQRGFQGSSRVITSINDLLDEIINLAR